MIMSESPPGAALKNAVGLSKRAKRTSKAIPIAVMSNVYGISSNKLTVAAPALSTRSGVKLEPTATPSSERTGSTSACG